MGEEWRCQYRGCKSSEEQITNLRRRKPTGFPHDEAPDLRVCTVCRRLPLAAQEPLPEVEAKPEASPEAAAVTEDPVESDEDLIPVLEGVLDDLECIDSTEACLASLVEVICYYKNVHGNELARLWNKSLRKCEAEQVIPLVRVMEDVLLHDVDKAFRQALASGICSPLESAWSRLTSDRAKRRFQRTMLVWQLFGLFEGPSAKFVDAVLSDFDDTETSEDEEAPAASGPEPSVDAQPQAVPEEVRGEKRKREDGKRTLDEEVARILSSNVTAPLSSLAILEVAEDGLTAAIVRKAYRRLALVVHPDKNAGSSVPKQDLEDAFARVQKAREQAEKIAANPRRKCTPVFVQEEVVVPEDLQCRFPGCKIAATNKCPNFCCPLLIKHCQTLPGRRVCYFHPPPTKR